MFFLSFLSDVEWKARERVSRKFAGRIPGTARSRHAEREREEKKAAQFRFNCATMCSRGPRRINGNIIWCVCVCCVILISSTMRATFYLTRWARPWTRTCEQLQIRLTTTKRRLTPLHYTTRCFPILLPSPAPPPFPLASRFAAQRCIILRNFLPVSKRCLCFYRARGTSKRNRVGRTSLMTAQIRTLHSHHRVTLAYLASRFRIMPRASTTFRE